MNVITRGLILSLAVVAMTACKKDKNKKAGAAAAVKAPAKPAAQATTPSMAVLNADEETSYQIAFEIPENNGTLSKHVVVVNTKNDKVVAGPGLAVYPVGFALDTVVIQKVEGKTLMLYVFGRNSTGNLNSFNYLGSQTASNESQVFHKIDSAKAFAICDRSSVSAQFKLMISISSPDLAARENDKCVSQKIAEAQARLKKMNAENTLKDPIELGQSNKTVLAAPMAPEQPVKVQNDDTEQPY